MIKFKKDLILCEPVDLKELRLALRVLWGGDYAKWKVPRTEDANYSGGTLKLALFSHDKLVRYFKVQEKILKCLNNELKTRNLPPVSPHDIKEISETAIAYLNKRKHKETRGRKRKQRHAEVN